MPSATAPALSQRLRAQIDRPTPIRQIMKMAERQNILAMGLDPAQVISFGGGWVNHEAPEEFRQAYRDVVKAARDRIAKLKAEGKSRDEVIAAKPTADLDAKWGTGFMKGDSFVGLAYDSLK